MLLDKFDGIKWDTIGKKMAEGISGINWSQAGMDFSAFVSRVA
jgi:hypothetical protein